MRSILHRRERETKAPLEQPRLPGSLLSGSFASLLTEVASSVDKARACFFRGNVIISAKLKKLSMLSCVTHICVQLPDLKFSPPRAWSELGVKKRGLSVDMIWCRARLPRIRRWIIEDLFSFRN